MAAEPLRAAALRRPPLSMSQLLALLRHHRDDPTRRLLCLRALDDCVVEPLLDDDCLRAVPVVLAAMRADAGDTTCFRVLARLYTGRGEDALASVVALGGVVAVVQALRERPSGWRVLGTACGALNSMTVAVVLRDAAVDVGAVPAVVAALRALVESDGACADAGYAAMCALDRLALHPRALAQATAAGAATAMVAALRAWPDDAGLQLMGITTLDWLCTDDESSRTCALCAGALEAILAAMRANSAHVKLQCACCAALGTFATDKENDAMRRSCTRDFLAAATAQIVAAMSRRSAVFDMQLHGCYALSLLLCFGDAEMDSSKDGTLAAALAACRAYPASAEMQVAALDVLTVTSDKCRRNAIAATVGGALNAFVAAMRTHAKHADIQCRGCCTLLLLFLAHPRAPVAAAAAGAAGVVEAVVAALRRFSADVLLCAASCELLGHVLAQSPSNAARAHAAGAVEAVAAGLRSMADTRDSPLTAEKYGSPYDGGLGALDAMTFYDPGAAPGDAVHAGVFDFLASRGEAPSGGAPMWAGLLSVLRAAAERHDAAPCARDGCARCGAARGRGDMCALPGCGARRRDAAGAGVKLRRCAGCRAAFYCGAEHQRADWACHKTRCAALAAASTTENRQ